MNHAIMIADEIAATLQHNGPLWSLQNEWCSQAFQQTHAIRAMLGAHRVRPRKIYLQTAKDWADMTLRMQGTQGHPARYNMGYGLQIRKGIPRKWYVADCGTIALGLLDVATFLRDRDPMRARLIDSTRRFADYIIETWTLADGSFTLGFDEFKCLNKKAYHCANAQSNLFLWPLAEVSGEPAYAEQALKTTRWLAEWDEYDCGYYGCTVHNRAYNGESMLVSLAYMPPGEKALRKSVVANLRRHVAGWAGEQFGKGWYGGGRPSNAKDPLVLMAAYLFEKKIGHDRRLGAIIAKAYRIYTPMLKDAFAQVGKRGVSGWAIANHVKPPELLDGISLPKFYTTSGLLGMALVVREDAGALYPLAGL